MPLLFEGGVGRCGPRRRRGPSAGAAALVGGADARPGGWRALPGFGGLPRRQNLPRPKIEVEQQARLSGCSSNALVVVATVRNTGALDVSAGAEATLFKEGDASGTEVGTQLTPVPLLAGQATQLSWEVPPRGCALPRCRGWCGYGCGRSAKVRRGERRRGEPRRGVPGRGVAPASSADRLKERHPSGATSREAPRAEAEPARARWAPAETREGVGGVPMSIRMTTRSRPARA